MDAHAVTVDPLAGARRECGADVLGMGALVERHQAEVIFGRALHAGAEVAAMVEGRIVEAVEQREHLAMSCFELGAQLVWRRVAAAP